MECGAAAQQAFANRHLSPLHNSDATPICFYGGYDCGFRVGTERSSVLCSLPALIALGCFHSLGILYQYQSAVARPLV
ncbi:hypothetical protein EVAR_69488_1 [Eumeta japonica]|uniref:Uncharacterized protein n=1 Tax=Eumeta variegata TaxID=151549 RepID=A0A4C2ADJ3_EUMVA|nr:hypothetical protein EVAR_69488_1 [Eumeta japonica]